MFPDEPCQLALDLTQDHQRHALEAACAATLLLDAVRQIDQPRVHRIAAECITLYLNAHGIPHDEFERAMKGLERARLTAEYLSSLPP